MQKQGGNNNILIIGAGIAGLAAASELFVYELSKNLNIKLNTKISQIDWKNNEKAKRIMGD